jgi:anti-anti-sigma factor
MGACSGGYCMNISMKEDNGITVLSVSGRLDAVSSEAFITQCSPRVSEERRIVIDLSALDYMSSAGVRSILLLARQLKEVRGMLAIAGARGMVKEVFAITNLDSVFPCFETVGQASTDSWKCSE